MKTKCLNWPIKRWTIFLALIFLLPASALPKQFKDQKIVTVKGVISFDKLPRGKDFQLAIITHIAEGWHINAHVPSQDFLVPTELVFDKIEGISFGKIVYPLAIYKSFAFTESELAVYEGEITFAVSAHISDNFPLGKSQITGSLHYQACNDQACLPPSQAPFSIPIEVVPHDQPARAVNEEIFSKFDFAGPKATSGAARKEYTAEELKAKQIIDKGLPYAIIAFFIVGLGLNLTPCVYPVIPITISFFGGQSDRRRGSSAVLALFYVIGIAIIFAVLGLVSGIAGKQWGFLFQNPWFVVIIVVIMLLLAASMFGAFEIRLPSRLMTTLGTARTGIIGSLIMGLTVGVVIAPCAAGVVIGLLGLVAKLGIVLKGTLLFFILGLGLGLPYLVLATFSGLLNRLPQSGMWMVWIRKLFGILLIGVAIYFLLPQLLRVPSPSNFLFGILGILGGLLLGFLDHTPGYSKGFKIGRGIFGAALIFLSVLLVDRGIHAGPAAIEWKQYRGESIAELRQAGLPIFFDFYADWCAPCKKLDKETFSDKRVMELAKEFTMVKVDGTVPTEAVRALMEQFQVKGVPTLIFLDRKGQELEELRTIGFIDADAFLKKMMLALK